MDLLNILFQYSLLHLYAPIINSVGFSHPFTFIIITAHNTFSLTYLLLIVVVAYPVLHEKTWLLPAAVTSVWMMISINVIITLNIPAATAMATILPHGWLEFTAIIYWTNALRKAAKNNDLPKTFNTPSFKDYLKALPNPKTLITLAKTDIQVTLKTTKILFKTLFRNLKKAYLKMLILIATAALLETYVTPYIMFLVENL